MPGALPIAALEAAAGAAATLGLTTGGLLYAASWPTSQIFGRTLLAGDDPAEVALTYDDGPNPTATPDVLDLLARHTVHATFFLIGDYARQHPELVRRIVAEGHLLGNHTMRHPRLSYQSATRIQQELTGCNAVLEDITGKPIRFFRPPFGARRPYVLRAARELGLTPVLWNVTSYDWKPIGPTRILANLERGIAHNRSKLRGSNLLLHDGGHITTGSRRSDTILATERLLTAHRGTPTRFVTVDAWTQQPADS